MSPNPTEIPKTGFMRLPQILALLPISKSSWWAGCKNGKYPAPVKLSPRISMWDAEKIRELFERLKGGGNG